MEGFIDERRKCEKKFPSLKYTILILTIFSIATCISVFAALFKGNVTVLSPLNNFNEGGLERHKNKRSIASETQEECKSVCTSPECLEAASQVLSAMDTTVDPCDDFEAFSCGNRAQNSFMPNNRGPLSFQFLLEEMMFLKMRQTIETVDTENPESASYKRKLLFDSCMKYAHSTDNGVADLRLWFAGAGLPDWPRLGGSPTTGAQLDRLAAKLLQMNENSFFQLELTVRGKPEIFRGATELRGKTYYPRAPNETLLVHFLLREDCGYMSAEEYRDLSVQLLTMFGASEQEAHVVVDDMAEIEEIIKDESVGGPKAILECFPENALNNRWCNLLREQLELVNVHFNLSNSRIELQSSKYFEFLDSYFDQVSRRKQLNFLSLKFILRVMEDLRLFKKPLVSEDVFPPFSKFCPRFRSPHSGSREQMCLYWLISNLHYILAPDYIRQHQIEAYSEKAQSLFQSVVEIVRPFAQNTTAFGEATQSKLIEMFNNTFYEIKHPIEYFTKEFDSNSAFTKLQVSEEFISNLLAVKKFKMEEAASNPHSESESYMRDSSKFVVQAEASDFITVSYGFLQLPAVGLERPRYLDYGHLGAIIAHEIAHQVYMVLNTFGFDDWSSIKDCLADQYSEYLIPELEIHVNGNRTIAENFADNLGFLLMYKAYERYLENFGEEASLPAIPFSNKQLMFIYLSQAFCEYGDKEAYKTHPQDNHSPAKHRILGSLKNLKEFAEVFNCPRGSPMNPENKCTFNLN